MITQGGGGTGVIGHRWTRMDADQEERDYAAHSGRIRRRIECAHGSPSPAHVRRTTIENGRDRYTPSPGSSPVCPAGPPSFPPPPANPRTFWAAANGPETSP